MNSFLQRVEQEELLDLGEGTEQDVVENLAEMQRINDLLGGSRAVTRHLLPRLRRHTTQATLLDLGTGGGGIPLAVLRKAWQDRVPLRILALDHSERNLNVAARTAAGIPGIWFLRADALSLPFSPGEVDYVISSLFLHHLSPVQVQAVIRQSFELANCAVIMSDLVRGWLPYLAFKLVQPALARNRLTRHDGALSVRRAYTPAELFHLSLAAGIPDPRVFDHQPWRMTLVIDKTL